MMSWGSGSVAPEVQNLLRSRLRAAAVILFFACSAFVVRSWYYGALLSPVDLVMVVAEAILALVMLFSSICLCQKWGLSLKQLRLAELAIFGLPALFLAYMQFAKGCEGVASGSCKEFIAESCIPWISLIYIYGLIIPNNWKRAAVIISLMGLFPIAMIASTAWHRPAMQEVLFEDGYMSLVAIWIGIPTLAAIFGSHTINSLRKEATAARQVGSYRLIERIGVGGMGEVYLAEHKLLKRPCAIKLIHDSHAQDPQSVARFETEVQASARLTHWNTIEIYDYGVTEDGTFYYVMEYLPGKNLQEIVDSYGPMSAARTIHILRQVCAGLKEAHAIGLIHRDIKPGNVFATERGGVFDVAKLVDFGLVKSIVPQEKPINLTLEGMVIGSPLYVAPEQAMGNDRPDARGDIYSLGAVAYFVLTGRPLFVHEKPLQVIFAHVNEMVERPSNIRSDIPADLEAVILKCLEKDPSRRYQTVEELDRALAACKAANEWSQQQAYSWWSAIGRVVTPEEIDHQPNEVTTLLEVPVAS
jgi:serine/threonine-protein kinase